jgi:hypothetical protein
MLNRETRSGGGFQEFTSADYRNAHALLDYWNTKCLSNLGESTYFDLFLLAFTQLSYFDSVELRPQQLPLYPVAR